ncbi:flagellar hook-basal body complex protein FliE [Agrobacterium larrymoorei]|nr:flagellar hook-basal body complex protein FliE [Agrobacterium larrymoorei]NTJ41388.1 flagellar hook-basal body complex protein FliE [Agrobacterium larrymoorei]
MIIDPLGSVKSLNGNSALDGLKEISGGLNSLASGAISTAATAVTGPSFASVLGGVAQDAVDSLKKSEALSFAGIEGKASTREVVDAVMQANQTLQTAVALRDRLVSAYLDVVKMQI